MHARSSVVCVEGRRRRRDDSQERAAWAPAAAALPRSGRRDRSTRVTCTRDRSCWSATRSTRPDPSILGCSGTHARLQQLATTQRVPLHRERILLLAVSSVFGRIGTTSGVMLGTLVDARLCSFVPTPLTGRPCAGRST